jgi:hypothetical protein
VGLPDLGERSWEKTGGREALWFGDFGDPEVVVGMGARRLFSLHYAAL